MPKPQYLGASILFLLVIISLSSVKCPEGQSAERTKPDRLEVFVVPFSHLDFFWGGPREECLARGNRIIAKAVRLAKEHPEFRFLIEDNNFAANYVETHSRSQELEDFKRLVRQGRIEIAPKWAAIFQNLPSGEVLARNLVYGKRYARQVFAVDPQVAQNEPLPVHAQLHPGNGLSLVPQIPA